MCAHLCQHRVVQRLLQLGLPTLCPSGLSGVLSAASSCTYPLAVWIILQAPKCCCLRRRGVPISVPDPALRRAHVLYLTFPHARRTSPKCRLCSSFSFLLLGWPLLPSLTWINESCPWQSGGPQVSPLPRSPPGPPSSSRSFLCYAVLPYPNTPHTAHSPHWDSEQAAVSQAWCGATLGDSGDRPGPALMGCTFWLGEMDRKHSSTVVSAFGK